MDLEQALAEIKRLQAKVDQLESDNFTAREKRREAEAERDKLKEQVPADDQVVIPAADAEALTAYQALGQPDELKQQLDTATEAAREAAVLKRRQSIRDAAGDQFNARALEKFLPEDAALEQTGEGDEIKWVVKQGETTKELAEVVKGIETDLGISLTTEAGRTNVGAGSNPGDPQHKGPNPWAKDTLNLTEQARLLRENPALAKRLMSEAESK